MNHLSYYQYQAKARGVSSIDDIRRIANERAYFYDRVVLPWLPADRSSKLVEIACGHGSFLCWLRDRGYQQTVGIDSSQEQIELAAQTGTNVELDDAIAWVSKQPDSSVDAIVAIDFAEHISKDLFVDFLHHSRRALKPGGKLIMRLPNGDSPFVGMNLFNDITHIWTYTPNCLESLGRMYGFSQFSFDDEGTSCIRDQRWIKVPLSRISQRILGFLFVSAAKVSPKLWSPHLWASLERE